MSTEFTPHEREEGYLDEIDKLSHSAGEKDAEKLLVHHRPIIWRLIHIARKNFNEGRQLGAAEEREKLQEEVRSLREALKKMVEPLPLDKNPKLTVSEAFDIFASRIGIGTQALSAKDAPGEIFR